MCNDVFGGGGGLGNWHVCFPDVTIEGRLPDDRVFFGYCVVLVYWSRPDREFYSMQGISNVS